MENAETCTSFFLKKYVVLYATALGRSREVVCLSIGIAIGLLSLVLGSWDAWIRERKRLKQILLMNNVLQHMIVTPATFTMSAM